MRLPIRNLIKLSTSLIFGLTSGAPLAFAGGKQTCESLPQECAAGIHSADNSNTVAMAGGVTAPGMSQSASQTSALRQAGSQNLSAASAACQKLADKCASVCKGTTDQEWQKKLNNCKAQIAEMVKSADAGATASAGDSAKDRAVADATKNDQPPPGVTPESTDTGSGSGSGMSPLAMGAIGALAGGLLGYMMGKKGSKKDENSASDGALQANGQVDCSKADAYQYQDCNTYLSGMCMSEISAGTYASDARCVSFGNRYCASTGATSSSGALVSAYPVSTAAASTGMATSSSAPPMGAAGEGVGSQVCQSVMALNYCTQGGRDQCPSCLQLARNQTASCQSNPALCLAQNSPSQIDAAKATCPTDPAFSNPAYAAGGGAVAAQINTSGAALPSVVLPQSVGASAANTSAGVSPLSASGEGAATSGIGAAATSGIGAAATSGIGAAAASGSAQREGKSVGPGSASASGASGGSASVSVGLSPSSVNSSGRSEVASGGSATAGNTSTNQSRILRGPASDVQGQFGPSLFAMGSQVYRQHCQAKQLNNCP